MIDWSDDSDLSKIPKRAMSDFLCCTIFSDGCMAHTLLKMAGILLVIALLFGEWSNLHRTLPIHKKLNLHFFSPDLLLAK